MGAVKIHRPHPGLPALLVRDRTDVKVYREVCEDDSYGLASLAAQKFSPRLVFDIGANIGCFVAFAIAHWPETTVVAVEADSGNAAFLRRNVERVTAENPAARVHVVEAALMPGVEKAVVYGSVGHQEMTASRFCVGLRAGEKPRRRIAGDGSAYPYGNYCPLGECATTTMRRLIEEYGRPDFVKLDCEGGEVAWLEADDDEFPSARLAGEWHDRRGKAVFAELLSRRYPDRSILMQDCGAGPNRGMFKVL